MALARSISRPRAKVTPCPLTAPTWKPGLGMLTPDGQDAGHQRGRRIGRERERRRAQHRGGDEQPDQRRASRRPREHGHGGADRDEVEDPLGVVLGHAHAAVRGGVRGHVRILVHGDAAGERRRPQQPLAERRRPPARVLARRPRTSRSASASRACPSRRRSPGRPGCPGSPARADDRSSTSILRPAATRLPADPARIGVGCLAVESTLRVRASATPVRGRPCHFWKATTAVCRRRARSRRRRSRAAGSRARPGAPGRRASRPRPARWGAPPAPWKARSASRAPRA